MFEDFFEEKKLRHSLAKIEKQHEIFKSTKKYKDLTAQERWEEDQAFYQCEYAPISDELEVLTTNRLLRRASKLSIPFPRHWEDKEEKYWDIGQYGTHYLKVEGRHQLIKTIREEEKARNEARIWRLPLFSALVTALSVLLGVLLGASIK